MGANSIITAFYHLRQADIWFEDGVREYKFSPMATKADIYRKKVKSIFNDFILWPPMADIRDEVRKHMKCEKQDVNELQAIGLRLGTDQLETLIKIALEMEKGESFKFIDEQPVPKLKPIRKPRLAKAAV